MRSVARVRIWLILIHERFGRPRAPDSSVKGKPARGSWLVSATAMTVPDRSLKTSWLRIKTGRSPASFPAADGVQICPADLTPSVLGPSLSAPSESLFSKGPLFVSVQFRAFICQACPRGRASFSATAVSIAWLRFAKRRFETSSSSSPTRLVSSVTASFVFAICGLQYDIISYSAEVQQRDSPDAGTSREKYTLGLTTRACRGGARYSQ